MAETTETLTPDDIAKFRGRFLQVRNDVREMFEETRKAIEAMLVEMGETVGSEKNADILHLLSKIVYAKNSITIFNKQLEAIRIMTDHHPMIVALRAIGITDEGLSAIIPAIGELDKKGVLKSVADAIEGDEVLTNIAKALAQKARDEIESDSTEETKELEALLEEAKALEVVRAKEEEDNDEIPEGAVAVMVGLIGEPEDIDVFMETFVQPRNNWSLVVRPEAEMDGEIKLIPYVKTPYSFEKINTMYPNIYARTAILEPKENLDEEGKE